jgi:hypothetical protein
MPNASRAALPASVNAETLGPSPYLWHRPIACAPNLGMIAAALPGLLSTALEKWDNSS